MKPWGLLCPSHSCAGQVRSLSLQQLGIWPPHAPCSSKHSGKIPSSNALLEIGVKIITWGLAFPSQGQQPQNQIKLAPFLIDSRGHTQFQLVEGRTPPTTLILTTYSSTLSHSFLGQRENRQTLKYPLERDTLTQVMLK